MNEPISWDPSLVKKFSSSNHYKLLNQLRNEVKKYPLNNKKKISTIQSKDTQIDNRKVQNVPQSTNIEPSNNFNETTNNNNSTVSFNNAKNFSIYNQTTKNNIIRQNESSSTEQIDSKESSSTPSFKDRLNQVDMK